MRLLLATLACATLTLLFSCDKNTFETKPRIEIKSISTDELFPGQELRVTLNYFDKEGDLGKGVLTYIMERTPAAKAFPNFEIADTVDAVLPEFPDKSQAEITQRFAYDRLDEKSDGLRIDKNDTVYIRFTVRDKEGNQSDTIATKQIIAFQP
jgi:hypothetical protein